MDETIKIMISAAKAGGEVLRKYFGQELEITEKSTAADVKTKADDQSEQTIVAELAKHFPHYNIMAEETGLAANGSEYTFVIDPLDGSSNFVMDIPNFSISIALMKGDEVECGVVYHPITEKAYWAIRGQGAYMGDKKIEVNKETNFKRAAIGCVVAWGVEELLLVRMKESLYAAGAKRVFDNWSPAYDFCLLASGSAEGVVHYNDAIHDYLAGKLIACEAGAVITCADGSPDNDPKNGKFIASNNKLINEILVRETGKFF